MELAMKMKEKVGTMISEVFQTKEETEDKSTSADNTEPVSKKQKVNTQSMQVSLSPSSSLLSMGSSNGTEKGEDNDTKHNSGEETINDIINTTPPDTKPPNAQNELIRLVTADSLPPPPPQRRSQRKRKSTLVMINGQPVLRKNNYQHTAESYNHDAFQSYTPSEYHRLKSERRAANASRKRAAQPRPAKVPSRAEKERAEQNLCVERRVGEKAARRMGWLRRNVDVLAPFLTPKAELYVRNGRGGGFVSKELYVQPEGIVGELRDYQLEGLNFLVRMDGCNLGMILGDEMGLGKTLQTISLLCHLKETADVGSETREGVKGPSLVVCPLSVLYSWMTELDRWAPHLRCLRLHSSSNDERDKQKAEFMKHSVNVDVVVTTYEMAKSPSLSYLWSRQHFNYLILDEGHRIKNHESLIAQAVRKIHAGNRLILTGTPLQNNLVELWSLLNFLHPDVFTDCQPFAEGFDLTGLEHTIDKEKLKAAHRVLGLFMIRRMKDQVEKLMPPKIETKIMCPLSTTQIYWYKALLLKDINILANIDSNQTKSDNGEFLNIVKTSQATQQRLNCLFLQLRKSCIHPFLFRGAEVDIESTSLTDLIAASGKLSVLDSLLRSLYRKKHRVVLFSQFTTVLDILDDYARQRGWIYSRFDGATPRARRNYNVNRFNAEGSEVFLFLMSTRAGGMGLNLQTADTCVLFDSDWNPQPDIQAMARVHRIGQKKTVHVYRLVSSGTVEERMIERAQKKLYLDKMVNCGSAADEDDDDNDESKGGLSANELISTIKFGSNAVFGDASQNTLPKEDDIEIITDRNRTEDYSVGKLKGGVSQSTRDFNTEDLEAPKPSMQFGGVDFMAVKEKYRNNSLVKSKNPSLRNIADHWSTSQVLDDAEKRKRKSRIIMVDAQENGFRGQTAVLTSNNYDFSTGETSVFDRELKGRADGDFSNPTHTKRKSGRDFQHQDFCQVCKSREKKGLIFCPRCPVAVHLDCVGLKSKREFLCCSHHRCTKCGKNSSDAGGLLFPCQSCHKSFCEDCIPSHEDGMRLLGQCPRFEQLGYDPGDKCEFIHCSRNCESRAKRMFDWMPAELGKQTLPENIDVSYNFGKDISETTSTLPNLE